MTGWATVLFLLGAWFIFWGLDTWAFVKAKRPELHKEWWSMLPGSGFYVYWKYRK